MPEIKAISKNSVHQICSGQVILDLTTAVKELVENSLDASAKSVEVKLKDYGLDQVEVIDNGHGVEENNFEALTLKHHTSKLRDFGDLVSVQTFGFRGEALSSLCALCNVTVHTRHKSSSIGYKLEFDHDGLIKEKTKIARQIGTTVLLTNLFKTLPVRQKEFKRNIKKEYTKLLNIMSAYCLISTQARISCSNQTSKGQRVTVLSTQANCGLEQNIISLFTSKQEKDLIPFKQLQPNEQVCEEYSLKHSEAVELAASYTISGYLSNTCNRTGRSSPDRQFFFINSRPVDLPKVGKLVNQIYHQHLNRHQYPFVLLNIKMERSKVDVNVTPNKRKVFVEHEKLILAIMKTSLLAIYVDDERDVASLSSPSSTPSTASKNGSQLGYMNNLELNRTLNSDSDSSFQSTTTQRETSKTDFLAAFRRTTATSSINRKRPSTTSCARKKDDMRKDNNKQSRLDSFSIASITEFAHRRHNNMTFEDEEEMLQDAPLIPQQPPQSSTTTKSSESTVESPPTEHQGADDTPADIMTSSPAPSDRREEAAPVKPIWTVHGIASSQFQTLSPISKIKENMNNAREEEEESAAAEEEEPAIFDDDDDEEEGTSIDDKCVREVAFSMSKLQSFVSRSKETAQRDKENADKSSCFLAKIQPSQNDNAEKELSRNLSKTSFTCMKPLGQFNLGFIIAQLGTDLFIVDQHASDEIYNFEKLQETTTIHQQHLVVPKKLNLSAAEKMILTENKEIFERNGFDFIVKVEDDRDVVYLTRIPMSGTYEFGSEDVDELIFLLSDQSGVMCRPSRIRKMFASRACRKSVMIGTALSEREMTRLLHHMADIERPWNCPHGRPTMRHLIDLNRITTKTAE